MKIGIAGAGNIAFVSAGWLAHAGHAVTMWSRSNSIADLATRSLKVAGQLEAETRVKVAGSAKELVDAADVIIIALPVSTHRAVMDAIAAHLRSGQVVIVSSMSSLSALYLHEATRGRGLDVTVASFGTTVMTGRRQGNDVARITGRRKKIGVSALPVARVQAMVDLCGELFGEGFVVEQNALASALTNINPVAHAPLTVYNWTRIERAEQWSQYFYMTPRVCEIIEKLDAERLAIASAFGLKVRTVEQHFAESFGATATKMADIATEMHVTRNAIAGPVDMNTGYFTSDIPFGMAFNEALGRMVGVKTPATSAMIEAASLITGRDFRAENNLLAPLALGTETREGLTRRVSL